MFIESFEYSLNILRYIIKFYINEKEGLPIAVVKNNVRCLDYDMDDIDQCYFTSIVDTQVKVSTYNKTCIEVMNMV